MNVLTSSRVLKIVPKCTVLVEQFWFIESKHLHWLQCYNCYKAG